METKLVCGGKALEEKEKEQHRAYRNFQLEIKNQKKKEM
jgi:hypothetical protein